MFHLEMDVLCSELTPSLIVTEYRINVTDLDYIELGKRLEPTKNVVAINSNFTHKALDGYDQFISKPKVKRTKKVDGPEKASTGRGRTRPSDHTTFNACIRGGNRFYYYEPVLFTSQKLKPEINRLY